MYIYYIYNPNTRSLFICSILQQIEEYLSDFCSMAKHWLLRPKWIGFLFHLPFPFFFFFYLLCLSPYSFVFLNAQCKNSRMVCAFQTPSSLHHIRILFTQFHKKKIFFCLFFLTRSTTYPWILFLVMQLLDSLNQIPDQLHYLVVYQPEKNLQYKNFFSYLIFNFY